MSKFFLSLTLLFVSTYSFANILPTIDPVPGGIASVIVGEKTAEPPTVMYKDKRVAVIQTDNKETPWLAVIGIPLSAKPGKQELTITTPVNTKKIFTIKDKKYRTQYLKIKNKRKVTPNPEDVKRIEKENKAVIKALATWTDKDPFEQAFIAPVRGPISSYFGLRRVLNGKPRSSHSGLDIAAKSGTPIVAVASGIVLNAGNYFFSGNTIYLDHGQGLITSYSHLKEIKVKAGQYIAQGKVIGTVGKTGRVTGAHLHWTVRLNDVAVNPLLFIAKAAIVPTAKKIKAR